MDILAAETGWVLGNWGANGRELPDAAPDIPADTDLQIVMLGTNDLLQGRRPATAERMERFLTGLELARGKIPLFALPSRSPREWVPGQMLIAASRTFAGAAGPLPGGGTSPRPMTVCHFAEQGTGAPAGISPHETHHSPAPCACWREPSMENRCRPERAAAAPAGYGDISKSGRGLMERCPEH
ncbi:hypothetical protein [Oscillibacter sp.]|uniref:hypothetical protein n=1 Tax=Oscillibacter sp. TaxID=1945593 RepID=UPI00257B64AA|nr:hypothetical protein [Oscillibacter sp.]